MKLHQIITLLSTLFILSLLFPPQTSAAPAFPLKKSANNRYFVDQNNSPFFINSDSPWSLISQVSVEDAKYYLNDAANRGINSILVTLTEAHYTDHDGNYYNEYPFAKRSDGSAIFSSPNTAFFNRADQVIDYANSLGINMIIAPLYEGCCSDGWWSDMAKNTTADFQAYGEFIGSRYVNKPNIMYVWGDDRNPCGQDGNTSTSCAEREKLRVLVAAVKSKDNRHLHTYHWSPENSALELYNRGIWPAWDNLDFNVTYTYGAVQDKAVQDYNRTVNGHNEPFFLFESNYENENGTSAINQRIEAYNSILSGGAGHQYGNNPLWFMGAANGWNPMCTTNSDPNCWKNHLGDTARSQLKYIKALFESRLWYTLIPDQSHTIVTNGYNSGTYYSASVQTQDKSTVIAYLPNSRTLTVNLTKMSGTSSTAYWFNPRNGTATLIGTFNNTSSNQTFTSPDGNDWVLVVDDASKNYPVPGSNSSIPTATPTTIIPTETKTPTPTIIGCSLKSQGDADCNGVIDITDFEIFRKEYMHTLSTKTADFNTSGTVDIIDFEIWRKSFLK